MSKLRLAIDGNEANVKNRVGSNVYALRLIQELHQLCKKSSDYQVTVLLSEPKLADLPKARANWRYIIVSPQKFWTQWALPIHLFLHRQDYDLFFTPGHYAPRWSSVPYVTSVMDLAYLHFPGQFRAEDLIQLKAWTAYSVKRAQKVISISEFSKREVMEHYGRSSEDISVIYPAAQWPKKSATAQEAKSFMQEKGIIKPYFLYLGTLQPRKNIQTLIKAYETFLLQHISDKKKPSAELLAKAPQLVIAGKLGWLNQNLSAQIEQSQFKEKIILTGFVSDRYKKNLYAQAKASFLLSLYEGFGIPPLEAIEAGCLPVVANNSSLTEVVPEKTLLVDPLDYKAIARLMDKLNNLTQRERRSLLKKLEKHAATFTWEKSAKSLLTLLKKTSREIKHG